MKKLSIALLAVAGLTQFAAGDDTIRISRATVLLDRQVEIPARETGVLETVHVTPGMVVRIGDSLADLDSTEADLALARAKIDLTIAEEAANNEIDILAAKKSRDVSEAELKRSEQAVELFAKSVSQTELDRLRLTVERADLAIKQAEMAQRTAKLQLKLAANDVAQAERVVARHFMSSPLSGIVDQVNRQEGEWVKPGDSVFRILQLDRLHCQGLVNASVLDGELVGRAVRITVYLDEDQKKSIQVDGTMVFVGSEINSIKGDVRVRAEFENTKLNIRPGMHAEMEVLPKAALTTSSRSNESPKGATRD